MDEGLFDAIRTNKLQKFREMLDQGANVNHPDKSGSTPLILATTKKNLTMVKELLDRGANPNLQDKDGDTPLMIAARRGYLDIARELLNRGAEIDLQNPDLQNMTALDWAGYSGNPELVRLLLEYGASYAQAKGKKYYLLIIWILYQMMNPSTVDPKTGISNLMVVASNGPLDLLRVMIDKNPALDLNQQDRDGNTPLIFAVVNKQRENAALLLDRGANPNLANNGGGRPLDYAADQPEIEQMLIEAGAQ